MLYLNLLNLIANSAGDGLQVGAATVISNTFTDIRGRALYTNGGIPLQIKGNNFEFNPGPYDLYNDNPGGPTSYVIAQRNWWGTTNTTTIAGLIYDFDDDYTKGRVSYTPVLTAPAADAPAYVRAVTLTPESPVGIQTVAFDVLFSREMDTGGNPEMVFAPTSNWLGMTYTTANSGLVNDYVWDIVSDAAGSKWIGTNGGISVFGVNGTWTSYPLPVKCQPIVNTGISGRKCQPIVDSFQARYFR